MINAKLSGVARTLMMTLRARADEQQRDSRLLDDPWSAEWYKHMPKYEDYGNWYNAPFQLATVIRSRLIDDAVTNFVETHDNPLIVELGAGFSTRYFRLGEGRTTWVEVDLDEAIAVRRKLDLDIDDHWFLAADITSEGWFNQLPDSEPENICFIAEGVLMFVDPEGVADMIRDLREHFAGAAFVFDVVNPEYIESVKDQFERLQAPMQWGVTEAELPDYGLDVQHVTHLLLEYPQRWSEIGVENKKRTREHSGYVVEAVLA